MPELNPSARASLTDTDEPEPAPRTVWKPDAAALVELVRRSWPLIAVIALVAILLGVLYGPVLKELVLSWWENPDNGHGFIVPVFVGYVIWREKKGYKPFYLPPNKSGCLIIVSPLSLPVINPL